MRLSPVYQQFGDSRPQHCPDLGIDVANRTPGGGRQQFVDRGQVAHRTQYDPLDLLCVVAGQVGPSVIDRHIGMSAVVEDSLENRCSRDTRLDAALHRSSARVAPR